MLRRKNRLIRSGRTNEADALAARLLKVIVRKNTTWLRKLTARKSAKDAWTKVREITRGSGRSSRGLVEGLTAETFNAHHASISTDCDYRPPLPKHIAQLQNQYITEMDVFQTLDPLRPTATGVDEIPAWSLRLGTLCCTSCPAP